MMELNVSFLSIFRIKRTMIALSSAGFNGAKTRMATSVPVSQTNLM